MKCNALRCVKSSASHYVKRPRCGREELEAQRADTLRVKRRLHRRKKVVKSSTLCCVKRWWPCAA